MAQIVFGGINQEEQKKLKAKFSDVKISSYITPKTDALVLKSPDRPSSSHKVQDAHLYDVPIILAKDLGIFLARQKCTSKAMPELDKNASAGKKTLPASPSNRAPISRQEPKTVSGQHRTVSSSKNSFVQQTEEISVAKTTSQQRGMTDPVPRKKVRRYRRIQEKSELPHLLDFYDEETKNNHSKKQQKKISKEGPAINFSLRWMAPLIKKVIAFEGIIGAGKSTLSQAIHKQYPKLCSVYAEQVNESFLNLFYSDIPKYSWSFQISMLKTRKYQHQLALHDQKTTTLPREQFYLWDRSMIGDYCFALYNHLTGGISTPEIKVYESELGGSISDLTSIPFFSTVNAFLWLVDDPKNCKFRVENHRKNASEQGIPLDYYRGLDDIHFSIFISMMSKSSKRVLVLPFGQYNDPAEISQQLANLVSPPHANQNTGRQIKFVTPDTEIQVGPENVLVFPHDMEDYATSLSLQKRAPKLSRRAYLPIMQRTEAMANLKQEHLQNYQSQVFCFTDALKKAIIWHLWNNHTVCFYDPKLLQDPH